MIEPASDEVLDHEHDLRGPDVFVRSYRWCYSCAYGETLEGTPVKLQWTRTGDGLDVGLAP